MKNGSDRNVRATPTDDSPARELEFVRLHVHSFAAKVDAFGLESQALFDGIVPAQLDVSARAENPLPRQAKRSIQYPHDVSSISWQIRGPRDRSVG